MGRRKLRARYNTDSPELNTYSVLIEVEGCFDVKARSEEEIRDIIEEGFAVDCQNVAQMEMVDTPLITIHSIEEAGLEKNAAD